MIGTNLDKVLKQLRERENFPQDPNFEPFCRAYLRHTSQSLLKGIPDLLGFLLGRYDLLKSGHPDKITVAVENPSNSESPINDADGLGDGTGAFVTRVHVHTKDRPFIMATIQEYFRGLELEVLKSFHPVLSVRRNAAGEIVSVQDSPSDEDNESLVFLEVERIGEIEDCRRVRKDLIESMHGVKVVTDDFVNQIQALENAKRRVTKNAGKNLPYPIEEVEEFFDWLKDENFVFHGFTRVDYDPEGNPKIDPASPLGLLRLEDHLTKICKDLNHEIDLHIHSRSLRTTPISVLRTDVYSRVYRAQPLDYVSFKEFDDEGRATAEHVFIGSFSNRTITEKVARIPILRLKMAETLESLHLVKGTHYYKRAVSALNNSPKEEIFYSTQTELAQTLENVLGAEEITTTSIFLSRSAIGTRQSLIVVMPKATYMDQTKRTIYQELCRFFEVDDLREYVCWSEEQTVRLHYYVSRPGQKRSDKEVEEFLEKLNRKVRPWSTRLGDLIHKTFPGEPGERLAKKYREIFRAEYRQIYGPETAVIDIYCLEELFQTNQVQAVLMASNYEEGNRSSKTELRLFTSQLIPLHRIVPILTNFGLQVLDESYTRVLPHSEEMAFIQSFHLLTQEGQDIEDSQDQERLARAVKAILADDYSDHAINALILGADLEWEEVDILLAYRNYYLQLNKDFIPETVDHALTAYPQLSRLFLKFFHHRFSPDTEKYGDRDHRAENSLPEIQGEIKNALADVGGIAEDKILRNFYNLLAATLRTSYFKTTPHKVLSLKILCKDVWEMPEPRPFVETYVHGVAVEGVHLRGGRVARGGLRWSDRKDDFRTEVLGLMKTQMIKNALIVPVGAKGGFFPRLDGLAGKRRQEEAVNQYKIFIRGLLEISDSYGEEGQEIRPKDVFAWDDFDPYLVVAADKGTATFSDIANSLSDEYQFWLGDAFASGGSCGYSHKEFGITARGAWECVKRHFRELGKDIQTEPFTVAGIGDMGGDVFGNGMLLSEKIQLVAAFNHMHVFLDPTPDPASSYEERKRLFDDPKLTWMDYDRSKLSKGGKIVNRSDKVIDLGPELQKALGTDKTQVNGEELIRIILRSPVELLWNGGIGTYVKASSENHHEVRDKANDRVRVDSTELRCKVVGEGGNLGFSQKARIEFDSLGGRINTDSIDNSGGVDLSDHEVNLKILTDLLMRNGQIHDQEERNVLLQELSSTVVDLVLMNNYTQSQVISLDSIRSSESATPFLSVLEYLERFEGLDRIVEEIGDDSTLLNYQVKGRGIPRSTLAVLLAYAKKNAYSEILRSSLPDDESMQRYLIEYFPEEVHERFGETIFKHRLRREIIATVLANKIIDQPGMTYLITERLASGKDTTTITKSYLLSDEFLDGPNLRKALYGLDNSVRTEIQYEALLSLEETVASIARFLLSWESFAPLTWTNLKSRRASLLHMEAGLFERLPPPLREEVSEKTRHFQEAGLPEELAQRIAFFPFFRHLLSLVRVSEEANLDLLDVAEVFFRVGNDLQFDWLQDRAVQVTRTNEWEVQFLNRLSNELYFLQGEISKAVIRSRSEEESKKDSEEKGIPELLRKFYESRSKEIAVIQHELERVAASGVNNLIPIDLFRDHYRAIILAR